MYDLSATISNPLVKEILDYLGHPPKKPTLRYLNRMIHAYIRKVPWESVSRILKRHRTAETEACPRLPGEFWREALQHGFGGTCFESSLAFFSLLEALGYNAYLTVNNMGASIGCHAAIVVLLGGQKYLVDITIPVHAAIRMDPQRMVRKRTLMFDYILRPVSENVYEVERTHRSRSNLFTLIDIPVSLPDFQAVLEDDYSQATGRFLKEVVMVKVIDEKAQRFFSSQKPYKLEGFDRAGRTETLLQPETLPYKLAGLFQMPADSIAQTLALIEGPPAALIVPDNLPLRSRQHA